MAFHSACLLACQGPASVVPGPLPLSHCESAAEVAHSVFLIGDAGAPRLPRHAEAKLPVEPVLRGLRADVTERVGALGVDRLVRSSYLNAPGAASYAWALRRVWSVKSPKTRTTWWMPDAPPAKSPAVRTTSRLWKTKAWKSDH